MKNNPNTKFIFEHGYNNCSLYLNIKMYRGNNKLATPIYRKKTSSGNFSYFKSFIQTVHKYCSAYL